MLDKINQRVTKLEIPGTRQFSNRVSVFRDGVNFTIGEPDIPTPYTVKKAAIKAIETTRPAIHITRDCSSSGKVYQISSKIYMMSNTIPKMKLSSQSERAKDCGQSLKPF